MILSWSWEYSTGMRRQLTNCLAILSEKLLLGVAEPGGLPYSLSAQSFTAGSLDEPEV